MRYKISYEKRAIKELNKLPKRAVVQVVKKIDSLGENPYQAGVRKLAAIHDVYRARVGNYGILYEINDGELRIIIVSIGDRKDVYNR
ncbi:MAG: type II toxin-antitoxin system RelE/ParE family toxin [Dyadobacter sp.]|uniref:type II toxin-antitoxin system RelE family toxin n=1 Tax=Dyadobacter sp. TaxID=1914288 RepID=UPI001B1DDBA5|nr:type II toxin-antitoxin system RelE/ParE family toxin [Dyadobacter sp.]